jgi:hypothetical protein
MSNPVREKITTNIEKAKGEGKIRAEHIREIVKDAVVLAVAELKEGTDEIRSIVKEAISTVIADLKGSGTGIPEKITASIEGAIEGSTHQRQQAIAQHRAKLLELEAQVDEQQQQLDREISGILTDIKVRESTDSIDVDSEAINIAVNAVQERQESGMFQEQYLKLKSRLVNLDRELEIRYGDRYDEVKQQWEKAKTWYGEKKIEAEASGTIPLQQKQTEIERNVGEFGSAIALKEQEVKQQLQEIWEDKGFGSKH